MKADKIMFLFVLIYEFWTIFNISKEEGFLDQN